MKNLFGIAIFIALVACTDAPVLNAPPLPAQTQDTCNANAYAALVGRDATALERVMLLGQVRVIRPSTAVTADYRPERINFDIILRVIEDPKFDGLTSKRSAIQVRS